MREEKSQKSNKTKRLNFITCQCIKYPVKKSTYFRYRAGTTSIYFLIAGVSSFVCFLFAVASFIYSKFNINLWIDWKW